jgi:hypothetical protein
MTTSVLGMTPGRAAAAVLDHHSGDPEWLDAFAAALERRRQGKSLARILDVWDLSQSEAGRRFGVSRQAVAKWLGTGIPAERAEVVADLAAATDLLVRYVKRDRVAAVVRRPAPGLNGWSLLDLWSQGQYREILNACREMFDFAGVVG